MRRCHLMLAATCLTVTACAAAPRQKPLPTTPVEQGLGTAEAVRRELEGRWALVSLVVNTPDGRKAEVPASGLLRSDAYGLLQVDYRLSMEGQQALAGLGIDYPNPVISTSGRVVIDPQAKKITYSNDEILQKSLNFDRELAERRANPFALERTRHYSFGTDGLLTLSTQYDDGHEAAVSRWKRQP